MTLTYMHNGEIMEMTPEEEQAFLADQARFMPRPGPAEIKAEARRRILLIMSEDQQRNTLAAGQAAIMAFGPDPAAWPVDLRNRHAAAMAAWTEIERLRARSNAIEAMTPMPLDVTADALWAPVPQFP